MTRFKLASGKSFDWDGERFHRNGDYTPPTIPEMEELSDLLQRESPDDHSSLTEYLHEYFGEVDAKQLRRTLHAVEWIEEGQKRYLRSITATDLRTWLQRGEMRCVWCGEWLPDEARGRWFCSDECFRGFRSRCEPAYIRGLIEDRDKGVCAKCGATDPDWAMDHIRPVSRGGGLCGLDNYQTLCRTCHDRKTARQRRRAPHGPGRVLALSESPPQRLRDLAEYIRILPFRVERFDDRLRSAARCLHLAIQSGAFGEAEYEAFRVAFSQWINNYDPHDDWPEFNEHIAFGRENPPDALIAAWGEATWWLRDRPDEKRDFRDTFEEDCDLIAWLIDIEAVQQMTRAQYQDYCKTLGRTDVAENNRFYWREVEAAIQAGKPVPANVLAEYKWIKDAK